MTAIKTAISGQIAFITGASSGIGQAIAKALASLGVHLILTARRVSRLNQLAESLTRDHSVRVLTRGLDVRDQAAVSHCVTSLPADWRDIDILINNAGLALGLSPVMIDTNIKGLLYITRAILPLMIRRDRGHIINIGSTAGHWVYPEGNVYNATKFAVRALNEGINLDLAGTRIRCCSIDPGAAETEFSLVRFHGDAQKASQVYEGFQPLLAEDIARTALFIVSSPAHVNITNVVISPTAQRNYHLIHRKS